MQIMDETGRENINEMVRIVGVGGHRLLLHSIGAGWPPVVLDAGLGESSMSPEWTAIQREVSAFTQCCGYGRAGLGGSVAGSGQRTSIQAVDALHALLHQASIMGPFVLVGHSLGGLHAQLFAARYPDQVAGLVLVDATYEDHFGWLARNQLTAEEMEEQRRVMAGDNPEGIASDTALTVLQQSHWYLDVPLVVLMRDHIPPEEQPPRWSPEQEMRLLTTWRGVQSDLASRSPQGRLVIAERSGHNIQHYWPDLIVAAIREVVTSARRQHGAGEEDC
jgi:pimeloyl-ACP methyl ester carboxylesterase